MKLLKSFSIKDALKFGVSAFRNNIATFFLLWLSSILFFIISVAVFAIIPVYILGEMPRRYMFTLTGALNYMQGGVIITMLVGLLWPICITVLFVAVVNDWARELIFGPQSYPALDTVYVLAISMGISLAVIASSFLLIFCNYQMHRFSMAIYEGKPLPWTEVFNFLEPSFLYYCKARFQRTIKVFLGTLLFLIPGWYLSVKYYFAGFSFLDSSNGTISQDTKFNEDLTQDKKWRITIFAIIIHILKGLSGLVLFFVAPILYLAEIYVYEQLKNSLHKEDPYKAHQISVEVVEQ